MKLLLILITLAISATAEYTEFVVTDFQNESITATVRNEMGFVVNIHPNLSSVVIKGNTWILSDRDRCVGRYYMSTHTVTWIKGRDNGKNNR